MTGVWASEIAGMLGLALVGPDVRVGGVSTVADAAHNTLLFVKKFRPDWVELLNGTDGVLVLATAEYAGALKASHMLSPNPRLDFARAMQRYFAPPAQTGIAATARIDPTARLGSGVSVGEYCVVGAGAEVGEGTILRNHVVVHAGTRIGRGCLIKSSAVIGEEGFGFEVDDDGIPVRLPHVGGVVIGNHVELGALTTVAGGTLSPTVVGDHVKVDDHVHIAHNVTIGRNTLITACAEISGSVHVGAGVWIGPQASVMNGISIGDGALVGLGAVVVRAVEPDMVVAGNPATPRRKRSE